MREVPLLSGKNPIALCSAAAGPNSFNSWRRFACPTTCQYAVLAVLAKLDREWCHLQTTRHSRDDLKRETLAPGKGATSKEPSRLPCVLSLSLSLSLCISRSCWAPRITFYPATDQWAPAIVPVKPVIARRIRSLCWRSPIGELLQANAEALNEIRELLSPVVDGGWTRLAS